MKNHANEEDETAVGVEQAPESPSSSSSILNSSFLCPLTLEVMTDPVIDKEGNSYERAAIEEWLTSHDTSPLTKQPLSILDLVPNRAMKDALDILLTQQQQQQQAKPKPRKRIAGLSVRAGGLVDGISVHFSDSTSTHHGGSGGTEQFLTLGEDEYITSVRVRHGTYVQCLTFFTNIQRQMGPWGGEGGFMQRKGKESDATAPPGCMLVGVFGRGGKYLDAIGFHWAPLPIDKDDTVLDNTEWGAICASTQYYGGSGGSEFDSTKVEKQQVQTPRRPSTWKSLCSVVGIGVGKIRIIPTQSHYERGDTVTGTIQLDLEDPVPATQLFVTLLATQKGTKPHVNSEGTVAQRTTTNTIHRFDRELSGEKTYEAGKHEYRFKLHIPKKAEVTADGFLGASLRFVQNVAEIASSPVVWSVQATLVIPWKANLSKTIHLSVAD